MASKDGPSEDLHTLMDVVCTKAEDILRRIGDLLSEYKQFNDLRQKLRTSVVVPGQKIAMQSVKAEEAAVSQALGELRSRSFIENSDPAVQLAKLKKFQGRLENSNVPSLQTAWEVVKRCSGLVQLACQFSLHPQHGMGRCSFCKDKKCPPKGRQDSDSVVWVDAVVDGGAEWLRIISIEPRRLLGQMAEAGWDWGAESDSASGSSESDDDEPGVPVAETVRRQVKAALANRHNYRPPRLHFVFTRIAEGSEPEIDRLIRMLRLLGKPDVEVRIDCSNSEFLATPPPRLDVALQRLAAEDRSSITPTVNLDCSILIALASDVSHFHIEIQPWHRRDVAAQIREEAEAGSSLEKALYPVLRSRKLVCTAKAARRFWEIVENIATKAEAARAELMLPKPGTREIGAEERVAGLQALSVHPVDPQLRLPIEVVEHDSQADLTTGIETGRLPRSAEVALEGVTDLNKDIFLYGWMNGVTTITANNTLAKQIEQILEQNRTNNDERGPNIWVFPFTRALATKGRPPPAGSALNLTPSS